jgi:hypothetical protein
LICQSRRKVNELALSEKVFVSDLDVGNVEGLRVAKVRPLLAVGRVGWADDELDLVESGLDVRLKIRLKDGVVLERIA